MNNRDKFDSRHFLLDNQEQVAELCALIRSHRRFAFDTEFIGEHSYTPRVCLVQVAAADRLVLVDPQRFDLAPIWELVIDPKIETIVFAGQQDFEICASWTGAPPANVFDIQVAAGLVGVDYPISYSRLAAELFAVTLRKKETYSDWSRRPLSKAQLRYAVEDVRYLIPMREQLGALLGELGRYPWLREEMQSLEDAASYDPMQTASPTGIKGHRMLTPRQLAVLGELARWREHAAWSQNVPARKYALDECLVDLARRQPESAEAILRFRGFPRDAGLAVAEAVLDAIRRGLAVPDEQCPLIVDDGGEEGNGVGLLADLGSVVGRSLCVRERIAHRLFAVRRDYEDLARVLMRRTRCPTKDHCRLLTGWRRDIVDGHLVPVLSGKTGIEVRDFPDQPWICARDGLREARRS